MYAHKINRLAESWKAQGSHTWNFFANFVKKQNPRLTDSERKTQPPFCVQTSTRLCNIMQFLSAAQRPLYFCTLSFPPWIKQPLREERRQHRLLTPKLPIALGYPGSDSTRTIQPSVSLWHFGGCALTTHSLEHLAKKQPWVVVGAFWKAPFTHCSEFLNVEKLDNLKSSLSVCFKQRSN